MRRRKITSSDRRWLAYSEHAIVITDKELEMRVLGFSCSTREAAVAVYGNMVPQDFYIRDHRKLFRIWRSLWKRPKSEVLKEAGRQLMADCQIKKTESLTSFDLWTALVGLRSVTRLRVTMDASLSLYLSTRWRENLEGWSDRAKRAAALVDAIPRLELPEHATNETGVAGKNNGAADLHRSADKANADRQEAHVPPAR